MTIYEIETYFKKSIISSFICLKIINYNSFLKIFSLLKPLYNFSPISVNSNFENAQFI